jgi:hypothetical protein
MSICQPGACCLPDGSCAEISSIGCDHAGGLYGGDGADCTSTCPTGACCSTVDGSCAEITGFGCNNAGFTYHGDATTCGLNPPTCPFGEYHNTINPMTALALAGPGLKIADDLTLAGTGARDLIYLDLRVFGNGGGAFNVTVTFYDGCPGAGGVAIPGTVTWNSIPDNGFVFELQADLSATPLTVPDTVWMEAAFSTSQAGWIIAGAAEVGFTENYYGWNVPPWNCNQTFGDGTYAGLWANLECQPEGDSRSASPVDQPAQPHTWIVPVDSEAPAVLEAVSGN